MKSLLCACVLIAGILTVNDARAATYYVTAIGDDGGNGSVGQPFRTIARGVSVLRPGDTLLVGAGTYREDINYQIPSGTSWDAPVTLRAADPGARPVLQPPGGTIGGSWVLYFQNQGYIIVDGFVLDGTNVSFDGLKFTTGAHHVRVQNSEVRNAPSQGVITIDGATDIELLRLDVHDNGQTDFDHGLYLSSSKTLVSDCRIFRNAGWGVHIYSDGGASVGDNTVRNSFVFDNARVGARGDGILLASGPGNAAYNNVVYGNEVGIWVGYGATNTSVYHNTVTANRGEFGILIDSSASGTVVQNNISFGNATSAALENRGTGSIVGYNLTLADPRFVSPDTRDYRLRGDSPAIGAGVALAAVPLDIAGQRRPSDRPAIGAYEPDTPPSAPTGLRLVR